MRSNNFGRIENITRVLLSFAWTALAITAAFLVLLVTMNRKPALKMAHWIWAPVITRLTGCRIKVTGLEKIDFSKPHIFVMNHLSTVDIPVIFQVLPVPLRFIVKKELMAAPFVGVYIWAMGMVFIDRGNRTMAIRSLQKAAQKIRRGASILSYPEGTRSDNGTVGEFKKGTFVLAIEAKIPVVPIAIEGSQHVMPKNTFRLSPHEVRVAIGSPIPTFHLKSDDRDFLVKTARDAVVGLHRGISGVKAVCETNLNENIPSDFNGSDSGYPFHSQKENAR